MLTRCNRFFPFIFVFRCVSRPLNKFRQPSGTLRGGRIYVCMAFRTESARDENRTRRVRDTKRGNTNISFRTFIYRRRDKFSLHIRFMRVI